MIIIADEDARNLIVQLADVALKQGGIKSLGAINNMLNGIQKWEDKDNQAEVKNDGD